MSYLQQYTIYWHCGLTFAHMKHAHNLDPVYTHINCLIDNEARQILRYRKYASS